MTKRGEIGNNPKEPIYKKMWFWMIVVSIALIVGVSYSLTDEKNKVANSEIEKTSVSEPDDSERSEIDRRASAAEVRRLQSLEEANPQSESSNSEVKSVPSSSSSFPTTSTVPTEYLTALNRAVKYSEKLSLSKSGIYDQLTSQYGDKYSNEAAQYAIDHLVTDYSKNALDRAKYYQLKMDMSPDAIREQLTSQSGDSFTSEEAEYAIQHLND